MNDFEWKQYLNDRKIAIHPGGFFVIVPTESKVMTPLCCSICDTLLRSRDDEVSHKEYGCCNLCAMQWAHARKKEWLNGWRPSKEEVAEIVQNRPPPLVVFEV